MRPQLVKPRSDNEETGYLWGSILPLLVWKVDGDKSCKPIHRDYKFPHDLQD